MLITIISIRNVNYYHFYKELAVLTTPILLQTTGNEKTTLEEWSNFAPKM